MARLHLLISRLISRRYAMRCDQVAPVVLLVTVSVKWPERYSQAAGG